MPPGHTAAGGLFTLAAPRCRGVADGTSPASRAPHLITRAHEPLPPEHEERCRGCSRAVRAASRSPISPANRILVAGTERDPDVLIPRPETSCSSEQHWHTFPTMRNGRSPISHRLGRDRAGRSPQRSALPPPRHRQLGSRTPPWHVSMPRASGYRQCGVPMANGSSHWPACGSNVIVSNPPYVRATTRPDTGRCSL